MTYVKRLDIWHFNASILLEQIEELWVGGANNFVVKKGRTNDKNVTRIFRWKISNILPSSHVCEFYPCPVLTKKSTNYLWSAFKATGCLRIWIHSPSSYISVHLWCRYLTIIFEPCKSVTLFWKIYLYITEIQCRHLSIGVIC